MGRGKKMNYKETNMQRNAKSTSHYRAQKMKDKKALERFRAPAYGGIYKKELRNDKGDN